MLYMTWMVIIPFNYFYVSLWFVAMDDFVIRFWAFIVKKSEVWSLLLLAEHRPQWFGSRCSGRKDRGSTLSIFQFRLKTLSVIPCGSDPCTGYAFYDNYVVVLLIDSDFNRHFNRTFSLTEALAQQWLWKEFTR